jgi:hypothetical protein
MKVHIVTLAFLLILSGCSIQNPLVPTTEQKIDKTKFTKCKMDAKIDQKTKQLVTGVKEILESKKPRNKEEQVSLDLTEQAERLLGGEPIEKIDVKILLDLYKSDIKEYKRIISEKEKTVTILKKNELDYESTIAALEQQLEREKARSSLWGRIKNLGISFIVLMIIGVVLLLIFAPNVLGWIVAKLPSLISLLGVTSFRVVKALVKGVQKVRAQIADMPEGQKLDKFEILKLIDGGLKEEGDQETTNTVETIRKKYNLESISKKLGNQILTKRSE